MCSLVQALRKRASEVDAVDRVKLRLNQAGTLLQLPQERRTVLAKERCGMPNCLRLRVGYRAQIKEIPGFRAWTAVPHLLCDDLGASLDLDLAPGVQHHVERLLCQWRADHDVDLASGQEQLDELRVLLIVSGDLLGYVTKGAD